VNPIELIKLADKINLNSKENYYLRVAFGIACIERVQHLLVKDSIIEALNVGKRYLIGEVDKDELSSAAKLAAKEASSHEGSNSIDGSGSAAVSTSRGVAAALSGMALEAAEYAAYASVYSYAAYAVTDLKAYKEEHTWQINKLKDIAINRGLLNGQGLI
jgi:hypothetical protein